MYYYLYDSFLTEKKYESVLNRVESRFVDLGIQGRIERMSLLKNMKEVVNDAIRKGADTLVICGDDTTVSKVISTLPSHKITLGIIPLGPHTTIAQLFGIPNAEEACAILSARIVETIDLAKVNSYYFLTSLNVSTDDPVTLEIDSYTVQPLKQGSTLRITNIDETHQAALGSRSNPRDGLLEAMFLPKTPPRSLFPFFGKRPEQPSIFPIKKAKITSAGTSVSAAINGQIVLKTPLTVEVLPKKLKVIVGRHRSI